MFEADQLCDRIAVISKGKIVAEGTPARPEGMVTEGSVVEVEVYGIDEPTVDGLRQLGGVRNVSVEDREQAQVIVVQTAAGEELTHVILSRLDGASVGPRPRASRRSRTRTSPRQPRTDMRSRACSRLGWRFHLKMLMRDPFNGLLSVLYPLFFATVAFFMFQAGGSPEAPALRLARRLRDGDLVGDEHELAGAAMQRERWHGTLELLVASPTPFAVVLLPVTVAMATIGIYSMVATLAWGRSAVRYRARDRASGRVRARPSPRPWSRWERSASSWRWRSSATARRGRSGTCSSTRSGWSAASSCRSRCCPTGCGPISWALAPTWGMNAIRESALGGDPLPGHPHVVGLGARVHGVGVLVARARMCGARERDALADMTARRGSSSSAG